MKKNKLGLTRDIPVAVKKTVRRRCGFGCVTCGKAIITYEHFAPPFRNAHKHDPTGITLLCGQHQIESMKGLLSKATIGMADRNPHCKAAGYSKHLFDLGGIRPKLVIGNNNFTECGPRIVVDGETLFEVLPPERKSSKWRLSARFKDSNGRVVCEIKENELLFSSENFDVEQTATKFWVAHSDGTKILELEIQPPKVLFLKKYALITSGGKITIGEQIVPDPFGDADRKATVLVFQTDKSHLTFEECAFSSPSGIILSFKNGDLKFGSL